DRQRALFLIDGLRNLQILRCAKREDQRSLLLGERHDDGIAGSVVEPLVATAYEVAAHFLSKHKERPIAKTRGQYVPGIAIIGGVRDGGGHREHAAATQRLL